MPQPRSRARRAARIALVSIGGLVVLVLVAVALGAWLLGRETTLQRVVREAEKAAGGKLVVEGVTGSLYDRVAFRRLVFRSETQVITVHGGVLGYGLEPFARRFTIHDARAAKVVVETIAKSEEPLAEPATLELPAAMRIDTVRVDSLQVGSIDLVDGATTTSLTDASLRGRYATEIGGKRWTIERIGVTTPWGAISGSAALAATRPFAIDGQLLAEGRAFDVPYRAPLAIGGRLADLSLSSAFTVSDPAAESLAGQADARVLPFREQPVETATVRIAGVSPKRWKADLPEADLAIDATIRPQAPGAAAGPEAGSNPFTGTVRIVNGKPGPIDRGRIPVAALSADVSGDSLAVALSQLSADLGAAGRLAGSGSYRFADGGTPSFDGTVRGLDLRAVHGALIATRFSGPLAVSRRAGVIRLDTTLTDSGRRVKLRGEFEGRTIRIAEADLALGASRLSGSGTLDLDRTRPFSVTGDLAHLNPRDFGDFPKADLNAGFRLDGTLGAEPTGRAAQVVRVGGDVRIAPSRVVDRPVAGTVSGAVTVALGVGKAAPTVREITDAKVALAVGANRIDADGSFGRPQDRFQWKVDAPRLAELGVGASGVLRGSGSVAGTFAAPAIDFAIAGDDLRYAKAANTPAYSVKSLRGQGRLLAGATGTLDADLSLTDFRDGSGGTAPTLQSAEVKVQGTRDRHGVTLTARSDRFDVTGTANGGLDATNTWRGVVDRLDSRGRVPFAIDGGMPLVASAERVEVGATRLKFAEGLVDLEGLTVVDGRITTRGRASGFPLSIVGTFSRDFARQVSTSLKFGGQWDVVVGDTIDGKVRLFRESGNIQFLTEPRFSVDPERLEVAADIVANRVVARVSADGRGLGRIEASIETRLSKRDDQWGLAGDAPLAMKSDIDIPDLRWLARLTGVPGLDVYGRLQAAVTGRGTVGQPLLAGRATGDAIGLRWPDQGINARDGTIAIDFDGDRVVLRQATLAAGDGRLDITGELRLANRKVDGALDMRFDRFEAISRTDRSMVVSGKGAVRFGATGIDVDADVKADRGSLQLAERRGPTMSNDIVVVGREREDEGVPARSVPVRFDVRFDMGDDFKVRGAGFDGRLGGTIRIAGQGTELRATGAVAVREGTYEGYGQRLTIDRGNLVFAGPIDNPALDIHAVRKNLAVEAGVQISGTALAPQARLTSNPNVPDTEKLSWLVLGHGLSASNKSDYALLTSAAAGLLGSSDSASIQSRIAATLGVDEIGFTGFGGEQGGLLTVGKQISSRLRVSFEQGLTGAATLLKIRYNVYRRIDLQLQTGTESALDIFYTFSFD